MNRENNQNAKPFAMFICSLLPGCAHMYLGLVKRGLQLLAVFLLSIGIASTFYGLEFILVPAIVVLYVYSFFDGYSIYRNLKAGITVEDESVIEGLESIKRFKFNAYWIGIVLIVLALIMLVQNTLYLPQFQPIMRFYYDNIQDYVPGVLLLALGIFLMYKGNKQRKLKKDEQERYR